VKEYKKPVDISVKKKEELEQADIPTMKQETQTKKRPKDLTTSKHQTRTDITRVDETEKYEREKEEGKREEAEEQKRAKLQKFEYQKMVDDAKMLDGANKLYEAQGRLRNTITAQLVSFHRAAKGDISPMQVSTEALKNKMDNPPELQQAPDFDPQTGKVIAQLATSIMAGLGSRHAGVASATAVGVDATAQGMGRNIANYEANVQAVAKKNEELMTKYHDDIDGLFKEYDKEQNKNVREYAKHEMKLTEMELAKDRMQLDASKFNAMSKQQASQHNSRMALENKKLSFKIEKANNAVKNLKKNRVLNLMGGKQKITKNTAIVASFINPRTSGNYLNAIDTLNYDVSPNTARVAIKNAGIAGEMIFKQLANFSGDDDQRNRAIGNMTSLLNKGVVIAPKLIVALLSDKRQIDTDNILAALRGTALATAGTREFIHDYKMKIEPTPEGRKMALAFGNALTIHVAGSFADLASKNILREKIDVKTVDIPGWGKGDALDITGGM